MGEDRPGLLLGERQVLHTELDAAVLAAESTEAEPQPGPDREVEARREAGGQRADEVHRRDAAQLVDVVEHQHGRPVPVPQGRRRWASAARCRDPSPTARARNTAGSSGWMRCSARATWPARRTGSPSASSTVTQANSRESSAAHWLSAVVFPYPAGAVSRISEARSGSRGESLQQPGTRDQTVPVDRALNLGLDRSERQLRALGCGPSTRPRSSGSPKRAAGLRVKSRHATPGNPRPPGEFRHRRGAGTPGEGFGSTRRSNTWTPRPCGVRRRNRTTSGSAVVAFTRSG